MSDAPADREWVRIALPARVGRRLLRWREAAAFRRFQLAEWLTGYRHERRLFLEKHPYPLDLRHPRTFNEKVCWRKIHDRNPLFPLLMDKYRVRGYVRQLLGDGVADRLLVPLYCHARDPDEIPFEKLPADFVVKATHGSGMGLVVRGADASTRAVVEAACRGWLGRLYGRDVHEWAYWRIPPGIVVEELLQGEDGGPPTEMDFHMFHGRCEMIELSKRQPQRFTPTQGTGGADWEDLRFENDDWRLRRYTAAWEEPKYQYPEHLRLPPEAPPPFLADQLRIAEALSRGLDYVRVDMYRTADGPRFGELTIYTESGHKDIEPAFDRELGDKWRLPRRSWLPWRLHRPAEPRPAFTLTSLAPGDDDAAGPVAVLGERPMATAFNDPFWAEVERLLAGNATPRTAILAPGDFLRRFPGTYPYPVSWQLPLEHFDFLVIHKGMLDEIEPELLAALPRYCHAVLANEVFVVYAQRPVCDLAPAAQIHAEALTAALARRRPTSSPRRTAAVVTTFRRPHCLARSLPQVVALGIPAVVVDDGSGGPAADENRRIAQSLGVPLVALPENRGLPSAVNVGVSYWLADRQVEWISCFQDDVDLHPELIGRLAAVQDARARPLLTGFDAAEHPAAGAATIGGVAVLLKQATSGQHLHAHRDFWRGVLPIPTPYLGAPKAHGGGRPGHGSDTDWWVTAWAPRSAAKRGLPVVCLPGLVTTHCPGRDESTWDNVSLRPPGGADG